MFLDLDWLEFKEGRHSYEFERHEVKPDLVV
jgi:hypothetical protein